MDTTLTYKTSQGFVTGDLRTWLSVILETMPAELRARVFEEVKKRESDKIVLFNPDGTSVTVLKAGRGNLSALGKNGG